jgi:uncharacterized protein YciI
MTRTFTLLALVACATTPKINATSPSDDAVYYLLLATGVPGKAPTGDVLTEHGSHLARLDQEGKLALAGPFLDRFGGAIVLRAANADEAKRIAEQDPMVRGGFETYELIPWKQATQRNHYLPKLEQR